MNLHQKDHNFFRSIFSNSQALQPGEPYSIYETAFEDINGAPAIELSSPGTELVGNIIVHKCSFRRCSGTKAACILASIRNWPLFNFSYNCVVEAVALQGGIIYNFDTKSPTSILQITFNTAYNFNPSNTVSTVSQSFVTNAHYIYNNNNYTTLIGMDKCRAFVGLGAQATAKFIEVRDCSSGELIYNEFTLGTNAMNASHCNFIYNNVGSGKSLMYQIWGFVTFQDSVFILGSSSETLITFKPLAGGTLTFLNCVFNYDIKTTSATLTQTAVIENPIPLTFDIPPVNCGINPNPPVPTPATPTSKPPTPKPTPSAIFTKIEAPYTSFMVILVFYQFLYLPLIYSANGFTLMK